MFPLCDAHKSQLTRITHAQGCQQKGCFHAANGINKGVSLCAEHLTGVKIGMLQADKVDFSFATSSPAWQNTAVVSREEPARSVHLESLSQGDLKAQGASGKDQDGLGRGPPRHPPKAASTRTLSPVRAKGLADICDSDGYDWTPGEPAKSRSPACLPACLPA